MDGTERVMVVVVAFQEAEEEAEAEVGGTQYKFCPMVVSYSRGVVSMFQKKRNIHQKEFQN